jgi:hypothetical protein
MVVEVGMWQVRTHISTGLTIGRIVQDIMDMEEDTDAPSFSTGGMDGMDASTHDTEDVPINPINPIKVLGGTIITMITITTLTEESGTTIVDGKTVPDLTYEVGFSFA